MNMNTEWNEWIEEFEALDTSDIMDIDDVELLDNFMDDIIYLLEEIE